MFVCPICNKEFESESKMVKHLSACWKELHPNHVSKEAPRGEDVVTRKINDSIANFFKGFC